MKVVHVSASDLSGGAARAAHRLHHALLDHGIDSWMRVTFRRSDERRIIGPRGEFQRLLAPLRARSGKLLTDVLAPRVAPHSHSWWPSALATELNTSDFDIIHLHWVNGDFLSVEDIGSLSKPVVWTLHDTWPFSGAEHYPELTEDNRAERGYGGHLAGDPVLGALLDAWTWQRKQRHWQRPREIVCPSRWLAACARRSQLMRSWPISVIPNVLPTQVFRPMPRPLAREVFSLPPDAPLVVFGALMGGQDPRKGWDYLEAALRVLGRRFPALEGVIFGQSEPYPPPQCGVRVRFLGHLHDNPTLAMLYSAADVVVVPSRCDNLPQTATEAQACGVPVVAFRVGGLEDVVAHRETGYLAEPCSTADLAAGVDWVLGDADRWERLSSAARERALRLWTPGTVVSRHIALYEELLPAG